MGYILISHYMPPIHQQSECSRLDTTALCVHAYACVMGVCRVWCFCVWAHVSACGCMCMSMCVVFLCVGTCECMWVYMHEYVCGVFVCGHM